MTKIISIFNILLLLISCNVFEITELDKSTEQLSYGLTDNKYEGFTNVSVSLSLSEKITNGTYELSITPSLTGTGLSFNTNNGTISGMPTSASSNRYMITATGTGEYTGSITCSIIIVIREKMPIIGTVSYVGLIDNKYQSGTNVAITPITLDTISGDYVASIEPDLPVGFSFDTSSGAISGTPTTASSNEYTVSVTGTGDYIGSISGSIIIVIKERTPITSSISYNGVIDSKYQGLTNVAISLSLDRTITGTYDLSIAPPLTGTGLSFDTGSGTISGTPTSASSNRYTVTVTGTGGYIGSVMGSLIIVIKERKPITGTISYTQNKYEEFTNVAITPLTLDTISGDYVASIEPDLLAGLSFDTGSGTISGTPTSASSNQYTVTVMGTGDYIGSVSGSIIIVIKERTPITGRISYTQNKYEEFTNIAVSLTLSNTITNGTYDLSIEPDLPAGLSFDTGSGTISGTPTSASSNQYTVTAMGTGDYVGSKSASLIIVIKEKEAITGTMSYTEINNNYQGFINIEVKLSLYKTISGTYDLFISPLLSRGLLFDANSGRIHGIPRNGFSNEYTVTAMGTGDYTGSITRSLIIIVSDGKTPFSIVEKNGNPLELTIRNLEPSKPLVGATNWSSSHTSVATVTDGVVRFAPTTTAKSVTITAIIGSYSSSKILSIKSSSTDSSGNIITINENEKSLIVSESITEITNADFYQQYLTSVRLGNRLVNIGKNAFADNDLTNLIIPNSVTNIGSAAFWENKIRSLTLGESVRTIGQLAFQKNQLRSVTFPASVESIGPSAFAGNPLNTVKMSKTLYDSMDDNQRGTIFGGVDFITWLRLDGTPQ